MFLSWLFNRREAQKTLIRWDRVGFRALWRWKSKPGHPPIPKELQRLIREMSSDNPLWGEERIETTIVLVVWNGQPGDGPGGTADVVSLWRDEGYDVQVIDINTLPQ